MIVGVEDDGDDDVDDVVEAVAFVNVKDDVDGADDDDVGLGATVIAS